MTDEEIRQKAGCEERTEEHSAKQYEGLRLRVCRRGEAAQVDEEDAVPAASFLLALFYRFAVMPSVLDAINHVVSEYCRPCTFCI